MTGSGAARARVLARCRCQRALVETAEPFDGLPAVRAAGIMLIAERHGRLGPSGVLQWQLLSGFAPGGTTALYCARCRRRVPIEHDELHRVALDRHARALTLVTTPAH